MARSYAKRNRKRKPKVTITVTDTRDDLGDDQRMDRQWIKRRLKELKKTQAGLAEHLGLPGSRVSELISGVRTLQVGEVTKVAEYLEWPPTRVLELECRLDLPQPVGSTIKVVGSVEAGIFKPAIEMPLDQQELIQIYELPGFERMPKFGLKVQGRSMDLVYKPGTILICVRLAEGMIELRPGMKVIACRRDDAGDIEATVKELVQEEDGSLWLWPRSSDPAYQQPWRLEVNHEHEGSDDKLWIEAVVIGSQQSEFPL